MTSIRVPTVRLKEIGKLDFTKELPMARTNRSERKEPMSNKHMVLVDAGALQMVRNALKRDAESGNQARAEMLDELDKATTPRDRAAFDPVAEVNSLERENERLRSTLRKSLEFVSKFTSGNTIQRDVRAIAVRSGPTIAQEATFLRDQINDAMNGANTN